MGNNEQKNTKKPEYKPDSDIIITVKKGADWKPDSDIIMKLREGYKEKKASETE